CFFQCTTATLYLHAFPTRRSSDLIGAMQIVAAKDFCLPATGGRTLDAAIDLPAGRGLLVEHQHAQLVLGQQRGRRQPRRTGTHRSEEHTSELQSRENLVCRLLLEK